MSCCALIPKPHRPLAGAGCTRCRRLPAGRTPDDPGARHGADGGAGALCERSAGGA